ncbi:MAG: hypothetical protein Q4D62_14315 [Planctomycetia bacterium]|nr:hypothetical protein [Planctomycetia bacterium]
MRQAVMNVRRTFGLVLTGLLVSSPAWGTVWEEVRSAVKPIVGEEAWVLEDSPERFSQQLISRLGEKYPQVKEIQEFAKNPHRYRNPELWQWCVSSEVPEGLPLILFRQVQQVYAEALACAGAYDEARQLFANVSVKESLTPQRLLFFRAVAEHELVLKEECLKTLEELEPFQERLPRRYAVLATLMRRDLEGMPKEGLEPIARKMKDIRRRLDWQQTGEEVQRVEREVIDSLDQLIQKLEEEERQRQQQAMRSSSGKPSGKPAEDARIKGDVAPGRVQRKRLEQGGDWGNLPPQEREESLQQIGRDFPPYYREAIEQYFKRMAE